MQQLCMYLRVQGVRAAAYFCAPVDASFVFDVRQHQSVLGWLELQQEHSATSGGTPDIID